MDNNLLAAHGYTNVCENNKGQLVGTQRYLFTGAIVVGIDKVGYSHRYCYETIDEAAFALAEWSDKGFTGEHPPGRWIKRKGGNGDMHNPNYDYSEQV